MKQVIPVALVLASMLISACRKKPVAPASGPTAPEQSAAQTPVPDRPAPSAAKVSAQPPPAGAPGVERIVDRIPTAPPNSSKTNPVDRTLTEALQRYNEANGKMPMDFSILVTAKYLKALPIPPPGKFFALDRPHMQVVLLSE